MPEVIAPVEEVGALVVTLAGSGLQIKRAGGALETVLSWNEADGSLFLSPGTGGGGVVIQGPALQVNGFATIVGSLTVTHLIGANAGMQIGGAAPVGATATALFSFEAPVTRIYVGDGTGYSTRFSKRVGGVTTDLVAITDTGAFTAQSLASATGSILVSGSANPYLNLDDGLGASYIQVVAGSINLSPRSAVTTVSGSLGVSGNVTAGTTAGFFWTGRSRLISNADGQVSVQSNAGAAAEIVVGAVTASGGITQYGEDTAIIIDAAAGNSRLGLVKRSGLAPALTYRTDDFTINRVTAGTLLTGAQLPVLSLSIGDGSAVFHGAVTLSVTSQATLTIQSLATNDAYLRFMGTATVKNWRLGKDISVGNGFDIQASATAGGVDFASIFVLTSAGNLTLTGSLSATMGAFAAGGDAIVTNLSTFNGSVGAAAVNRSAFGNSSATDTFVIDVYGGGHATHSSQVWLNTRSGIATLVLATNDTAAVTISATTQAVIMAGTLDVQGNLGLAIGGVINRRRIQSTGINSFSVLGDANGYADLAVATILLAPTSVAAPIDGQMWTSGANLFIRLSGVTRTVTVT